ncbi:hypothetical protein [Peribacillus sp. SCS-155]
MQKSSYSSGYYFNLGYIIKVLNDKHEVYGRKCTVEI